MAAFYNEIEPFAAQWLRNLIEAGHIAPGVVDERSIEDIKPGDLAGYTQVHFFAGIGVWSLALRRAGWSDDRPVWTGSCPCQPFSAAGAGEGFADERHLWPAFFHLIEQCKPATVIGEQVASKGANPWIDLVQADLEAVGYAVGAVAFPSASVGAPHIRDRLYWVADASSARGAAGVSAPTRRHQGIAGIAHNSSGQCTGVQQRPTDCGLTTTGGMGYTNSQRTGRDSGSLCGALDSENGQHGADHADASGAAIGLADRPSSGRGEECEDAGSGVIGDSAQGQPTGSCNGGGDLRPSPVNGFWRDADWLLCRDGKWRPVEPGTFPLAHGAPARVGRLRAYGNAINAQAAQAFIECVIEGGA